MIWFILNWEKHICLPVCVLSSRTWLVSTCSLAWPSSCFLCSFPRCSGQRCIVPHTRAPHCTLITCRYLWTKGSPEPILGINRMTSNQNTFWMFVQATKPVSNLFAFWLHCWLREDSLVLPCFGGPGCSPHLEGVDQTSSVMICVIPSSPHPSILLFWAPLEQGRPCLCVDFSSSGAE